MLNDIFGSPIRSGDVRQSVRYSQSTTFHHVLGPGMVAGTMMLLLSSRGRLWYYGVAPQSLGSSYNEVTPASL